MADYNPFARVLGSRATKPAAVKTAKPSSLLGYLQQAGFKGKALKTAWAIAKRESGGRPEAYNPNRGTGDDSYGLFQINMLGDLGPARRRQYGLKSNEDLYDPSTNARVAYQMSKGGTDFGAWGVGPNAYRKTAPLDFSGFPGAGVQELPLAKGTPSPARTLPAAPDLSFEANPFAGNLGGANPFASVFKARAGRVTANPFASVFAGRTPAPAAAPAKTPRSGKTLITSQGWTPTSHAGNQTSGLGWGVDRPADIMGRPGTPIGAPASGVITRVGTAQEGGQSIYLVGDDGYEYWLGHIDVDLPVGTRVTADQVIAAISGEHPRPHLHITKRRR